MKEQFSRTAMMLGEEAVERLRQSRVAVFGIGGVGGYAVEALARTGVGTLDLIDADTVAPSNLNRQIIALHSTVGQRKVDAAAQRIHDICPDTAVYAHELFFMPDTADQLDFSQFDYVIDAIDTVKGKLEIILRAQAAGVPVISAMGAGNKLDPTMLQVADIYSTKVCPLARVMRYELKKRGVKRLKVVYSEELPVVPRQPEMNGVKPVPGSVMFVPAAAGLILAGEAVRDLIKR
ncbi:MAG: tRNA threonylcarbamoyladenosine dehydratase [Oscillospiraceae bacterium]|nr:tRNA threonylcarbamoyladenosine dehydratase [Oscillospiraceae bacterium]